MPTRELRIAGLTKFSTCDWPGKITATLFLQGCPWDCFYCHNSALIDPLKPGTIAMDKVLEFLANRRGLLDGVVFSGGEPTMQRELASAMQQVSDLGFAVGLHTCGAFPSRLATVLPYADWVGLDIKESKPKYQVVTGRGPSGAHAWESLDVLLAAVAERKGTSHPLAYEVRTTVHTAVTSAAELGALADSLADKGVANYAVQEFRAVGVRESMPVRLDTKRHGAITRGGLEAPAREGTSREVSRPKLDVSMVPQDRFERFTYRAA